MEMVCGHLICPSLVFVLLTVLGRADLFCLTPDATAWLTYSLSTGDIHSLSNINWTYFGWILINQKVNQNQARFADLNGK